MTPRKALWDDPLAVDGSGINAFADGGTISFFDSRAFATAHTVAPSEAEAPSLTFDELSALYPGIVWPLFAEQTDASTTDDSIAPSSQAATATETLQATGPAGLDWWVTPDFDDDPDWHPGGVGLQSAEQIAASTTDASTTDDSVAPSSQAATATETPQATGPAGLDWWVTPDFDDDPDWHPGGVGPQSAEQIAASTTDASTTDDSIAPSSQAATATETPQATGPAGLDWWVTPDFDDDPDWHPGGVGPQSSATDDSIASSLDDARSAVTDSAQARLTVQHDETQISSLTFGEVSEQYPGIVWPADWWLL